MMTMDIRTALVKTASVEIKTLTVSGKQVTLAVFRQLKNEDIIDMDTLQLNGVPWGLVNYFWGSCSNDHLHVVWQKGNELRRSCVYQNAIRPRVFDIEEEKKFTEKILNKLALLKVIKFYLMKGIIGRDKASVTMHGSGTTVLEYIFECNGIKFLYNNTVRQPLRLSKYWRGLDYQEREVWDLSSLPERESHNFNLGVGITRWNYLEIEEHNAKREKAKEELIQKQDRDLDLSEKFLLFKKHLSDDDYLRLHFGDIVSFDDFTEKSNQMIATEVDRYAELKEQLERIPAKYSKLFQGLEQIDHLFIAV